MVFTCRAMKWREPFFQWLEPFNDMGAKTVTINNTGGTDHLSFDRVGIPGFQFIQDEIEYDTRTHHSNMDDYDHLVPEDLKQAAIIVATFIYNTAQRDEKIPRKELQPPTRNQRSLLSSWSLVASVMLTVIMRINFATENTETQREINK